MRKAKVIEELCRMRFKEIYDRYEAKRLSCEEAADLLGISIKTFYRKRLRVEEDDFHGTFDRRIGKPSPNRATDQEMDYVIRCYREKYAGWSVKHFYEWAKREDGLKRSYNWTRNQLLDKGVILKSTRGGKHRLRRERKPMVGMMIHQDGSTHRWILAVDYDLDLIVTMDDADSTITSCFLIPQEGIESSLRGILETIEKYGVFCTFYTDRGTHYFYTPEAGGKVDPHQLTQVGRVLKQLGMKHIAAYSPEARGRSERMFQTLQNRLPKELALKQISTIEDANRYIRDEFLPRHNAQFTTKPLSSESAFTPWPLALSPREVICLEEERTVQRDNTVRYQNLILQIPPNDLRPHYVKAPVLVRQYLDSSLAIFYGPLCIGRYDFHGNGLPSESQPRRKCLKGKTSSASLPFLPKRSSQLTRQSRSEDLFQQFTYGRNRDDLNHSKIGQQAC